MTWGRRWQGVPRRIRCTVGVGAAVLGYGGLVHVGQLVTGGWPPYAWAPAWLAAYFTSLTVCDPLAAVLLWLRRAAGLHLAILVLVTDALANGYALYGLSGNDSSVGAGTARASQAVISLLAVCALVAAPRVRPWLRPTDLHQPFTGLVTSTPRSRGAATGDGPPRSAWNRSPKGASDCGGGEHARNIRSG